MSIVDTELVERDAKTGRFVTGNFGGPGRKLGSRNTLGEAFIEHLRDAWIEHGATALARCAQEEPAQFRKIVASLMPKDINLNVSVDAQDFATKFRAAFKVLGNEPPRRWKSSMAVEQAEIDELQRLAANMRHNDELLPLMTPEVLSFVITVARAEGRDESLL
jgi:hypothetical protein